MSLDKLQLKKLESMDLLLFTELLGLFEDVFNMENFKMPAADYLQLLLLRKEFHVFVAMAENKVIGGLTAHTLPSYYHENSAELYIYDLAVATDFQRRKVGSKLMEFVRTSSTGAGFHEVFVQADEVDDYALDFYRSTGGQPEQVVHFTYALDPNNNK